jgi:hypothetical protein
MGKLMRVRFRRQFVNRQHVHLLVAALRSAAVIGIGVTAAIAADPGTDAMTGIVEHAIGAAPATGSTTATANAADHLTDVEHPPSDIADPVPEPTADSGAPGEVLSFLTPPGGVMTKEVGAITGPVEAWIDDGTVLIRYVGALDSYTVGAASGRSISDLVAILASDPGIDQWGNPIAAAL